MHAHGILFLLFQLGMLAGVDCVIILTGYGGFEDETVDDEVQEIQRLYGGCQQAGVPYIVLATSCDELLEKIGDFRSTGKEAFRLVQLRHSKWNLMDD